MQGENLAHSPDREENDRGRSPIPHMRRSPSMTPSESGRERDSRYRKHDYSRHYRNSERSRSPPNDIRGFEKWTWNSSNVSENGLIDEKVGPELQKDDLGKAEDSKPRPKRIKHRRIAIDSRNFSNSDEDGKSRSLAREKFEDNYWTQAPDQPYHARRSQSVGRRHSPSPRRGYFPRYRVRERSRTPSEGRHLHQRYDGKRGTKRPNGSVRNDCEKCMRCDCKTGSLYQARDPSNIQQSTGSLRGLTEQGGVVSHANLRLPTMSTTENGGRAESQGSATFLLNERLKPEPSFYNLEQWTNNQKDGLTFEAQFRSTENSQSVEQEFLFSMDGNQPQSALSSANPPPDQTIETGNSNNMETILRRKFPEVFEYMQNNSNQRFCGGSLHMKMQTVHGFTGQQVVLSPGKQNRHLWKKAFERFVPKLTYYSPQTTPTLDYYGDVFENIKRTRKALERVQEDDIQTMERTREALEPVQEDDLQTMDLDKILDPRIRRQEEKRRQEERKYKSCIESQAKAQDDLLNNTLALSKNNSFALDDLKPLPSHGELTKSLGLYGSIDKHSIYSSHLKEFTFKPVELPKAPLFQNEIDHLKNKFPSINSIYGTQWLADLVAIDDKALEQKEEELAVKEYPKYSPIQHEGIEECKKRRKFWETRAELYNKCKLKYGRKGYIKKLVNAEILHSRKVRAAAGQFAWVPPIDEVTLLQNALRD